MYSMEAEILIRFYYCRLVLNLKAEIHKALNTVRGFSPMLKVFNLAGYQKHNDNLCTWEAEAEDHKFCPASPT